jgi:hypothetical protein
MSIIFLTLSNPAYRVLKTHLMWQLRGSLETSAILIIPVFPWKFCPREDRIIKLQNLLSSSGIVIVELK